MEDGNENKTEEIGLELISKALILFGAIILVVHVVLHVFSAGALQQGWEQVWFLPRSGFSIVPVISILMIIFGTILYFLHLQFMKFEKIAEEVESGKLEK
jgi:amino acid transporter